MSIYFAVLGILGLGALGDLFMKDKKNRRDLYIFMVGLLIIFFGTRGYIGYDWYSYMPAFENSHTVGELFSKGFISGGFEKGYQVFSGIVRTFTSDYTIFSMINTLIDFALIYYIFKRYSKYPIFALFIYFGVYGVALEIDMIRNVKSILLFLCSIEYIEKREPIKFFLLNIIGFLFHSSSLLYFPMYFILRIKWNRVFILILFVLGNIYYLSNIRLIINGANKFPAGIGQKVAGYLSIVPTDFPLGFSLYYLERVILFIVVYLMGTKLAEKKYGTILCNSLYIAVFIFLYTSELSVLSLRVGILFVYSYWLLIPMIFEYGNKGIRGIAIILATVVTLFRLDNQINFVGNKDVYFYETVLLKHRSAAEKRLVVEEAAKYKEEGHGKELSLLF